MPAQRKRQTERAPARSADPRKAAGLPGECGATRSRLQMIDPRVRVQAINSRDLARQADAASAAAPWAREQSRMLTTEARAELASPPLRGRWCWRVLPPAHL